MQNKAFYPSSFDSTKHVAAVLMTDLNNSSESQYNHREFCEYCNWLEAYLHTTTPKACQCFIFPLQQGDCTKVIAQVPCNFIYHFNVINESAAVYLASENGLCIPNADARASIALSSPDVCSIGLGQIMRKQDDRDSNQGLAFNYAKEALDVLKRAKVENSSYTRYINITSIFPPVDFLLNVSSALCAKHTCLCLDEQKIETMQYLWLEITNATFSVCKRSRNWTDVDDTTALFDFSNENNYIVKYHALNDAVLCNIDFALATASIDDNVCSALLQLKMELRRNQISHFSKYLFLKKMPKSNRNNIDSEDEHQIFLAIKKKALIHSANVFFYDEIRKQRDLLIRFFSMIE